jgi:hypothetical protein
MDLGGVQVHVVVPPPNCDEPFRSQYLNTLHKVSARAVDDGEGWDEQSANTDHDHIHPGQDKSNNDSKLLQNVPPKDE